jgi:hypothetical protein
MVSMTPSSEFTSLPKRRCCEPKMVSVLQGGFLMESDETLSCFPLLPPRRMTDVVWTPPTWRTTTCKSPSPVSGDHPSFSLSPRRILISMPGFAPFATRQSGVSIISLQVSVCAHYALTESHTDPEPSNSGTEFGFPASETFHAIFLGPIDALGR